MIINLRIKNFYSLGDEVVLDFTAETKSKEYGEDLSKNLIDFNGDKFVNIIGLFGGNAAGKSNVIKAVNFCRDLVLTSHLINEGENFDFEPFKFGDNSYSEFTINYEWEGLEYEYSFRITKDKILSESLYYYPNKRRAKVFSRENTDEYTYRKGTIHRPSEIEANVGPRTLFISRASSMNRPLAQSVYRFFLEGITMGVGKPVFSRSTLNDIEKNKSLLLKAFEVSDSDITDFKLDEFIPGQFVLHTFHRENPALPFDFEKEESEGTKRLFFILLMLIKTAQTDTTIFFDEFDLRLHVRLAEFLLDTVRASHKSQMVFTSHNPVLINRGLLKDEQIVMVTKQTDGKTELTPLSDYEGIHKIKDLQTAYLQGRFDGVPYTGNAYLLFEPEEAYE